MGKKLIIHGADFSGITYGNYQFSVPNNSISVAPGESAAIVVTSSRVPIQNGASGTAQFCPFNVAIQGDASYELGQISGLTQAVIISMPVSATGSATVTFTQAGSGRTQSITVVAIIYHLSVLDPAGYDNGRIALGRTKTVIVTSFKEVGGVRTFEDFTITTPDHATAVKGSPSGTTCEVTIGIPYNTEFLGVDSRWEFSQDNGSEADRITMFGVPNWVLGYWYSNQFTKVPDQGAKFYVSFKDPASSTAGNLARAGGIDYTVDVGAAYQARFIHGSIREGDNNTALPSSPRTITSLNALLAALNSKITGWTVNLGNGAQAPALDYIDSADANGFYYPTAAQTEIINNSIVFIQRTR